MSISLTVNRQKLIDQITAKVEEIKADYQKQRDDLTALLAGIDTSSTGWAEYHTAVAAGLTGGTLKVGENGKILTVPGQNGVIPTKPNSKTRSFGGIGKASATKANVEYWLTCVAESGPYYNRDVHPYESALVLLGLSDDEKIEINGGDYNSLLSYSGRNWNWTD